MKLSKTLILAIVMLLALIALCSCGKCRHENTEWRVIYEPTCYSSGKEGTICEDCGEILESSIIDPSHMYEKIPAVEPTCTEEGYTEGIKCSRCGEIFDEREYLPIIPHTYDDDYDDSCNECGHKRDALCPHLETKIVEGTDPTCTEGGYTDGEQCLKCEEFIVWQNYIWPLGHTEAIDAAVKATCITDGKTEGKHCTTCGEVTVAQKKIAALGHKFGDWIETKAPTCTEKGEQARSCHCGETEKRALAINSKNHTSWGEWTETKAPTCTEKGKEMRACACGASEVREADTRAHEWNEEDTCIYCGDCKDNGLKFTFNSSSSSYTVSDYTGTAGSVIIPSTYKGYPVTAVGASAFRESTTIHSVTIGDNVTSIGDSAFYSCTSLVSVVIGESVTNIGTDAFEDCYKIIEVVNNSSLNIVVRSEDYGYVAYHAKEVHSGDSKIVNQNGYLFYTYYTYYSTNYLLGYVGDDTELTLPESYNGASYKIYNCAFFNCESLKSVVIPGNVTDIGYDVFGGCNSLGDIYYTGTIDQWCNISFSDYDSNPMHCGANLYIGGELVTELVIPDSVTSIRWYAFYGCNSLTSVVIPDSVKSIGSSAFYNCKNITSVVIGDNVTNIDGAAFYGCKNITSVVIGDNVTNIGGAAFYGCNSLGDVYYTGTIDQWCNISFSNYYSNPMHCGANLYIGGELVTELVIPDTVTNIKNYAFYGCNSLTSVVIPDSVISICSSAFYGCNSLTSVTLPFVGATKDGTTNTHFGYIFGADSYSSNSTYIPESLKTVVITGGSSIDDYAFKECTSLTSVVIGDSVTSIGKAFSGCNSLTSITLPFVGATKDGTTITHFGYIFGLWNYTDHDDSLPKSLKTVVITGGSSIDDSAFAFCRFLTSVVIPDSVTSIGDNAFCGCYRLTSVVIPDSVTSIGSNAFRVCTSLTSVVIPDSVTSIDWEAFYGCSSLTSVVIPDSVTSISKEAFSGCNKLASVTLPFVGSTKDGTTNTHFGYIFGADSYSSNSTYIPESLKTVVITGGSSIDDYAFYNCYSLTSVVIGDSVTSIGDEAFYGCSSLTSVVIPASVTSIGDYAFRYCYKLVELINRSSLDIVAGSSSYGYAAYYAKEVHSGESKIVNQQDYLFYTYNGVNYLLGYVGSDTELVLPASYNGANYEIYQYAFYRNKKITSIEISDSVTSIGKSAFYSCDSLTSIVIPDSVTSIGDEAFGDCNSLTSVVIGDSVTSIGKLAFYGCNKLVEVINKSSLDITAGSGNHGLIACYAIEVHNGESKIVNQNDYLFYTYGGVNYLIGYVGDDTQLTLPESFSKSYKIYDYAFYNCDRLTGVQISYGVTSIGDHAFEYCSSLTNVVIFNVRSIGSYAFAHCYSLTSVAIGASVTSIGDSAFQNCDIKSIEIPDSVTSIGDEAFYGCSSLTSIKYRGTRAQWNAISKGYDWNYGTGNYTITYNY